MAYTIHGVTLRPVIHPDYGYYDNLCYFVEVVDQTGRVWTAKTFDAYPTRRQIRFVLRQAVLEVHNSVTPHLQGVV